MYKRLGLEFEKHDTLVNKLHTHLIRLASYYRRLDPTFMVEPNDKRKFYRLPIELTLPAEYNIDLWLCTNNKKIKCRIKDISVSGCCLILPFDDKDDLYVTGNNVSILLYIQGLEFQVSAIIRNSVGIAVSRGAKNFLRNKFLNIVHPTEVPSDPEQCLVINSQIIDYTKKKPVKHEENTSLDYAVVEREAEKLLGTKACKKFKTLPKVL